MSAEIESLELIRREMARLQHDHICRLSAAFENALAEFSPVDRATLGGSYRKFSLAASAELVTYALQVRAQVVRLTNHLLLPLGKDVSLQVHAIAHGAFDATLCPQKFKALEEALVRKGLRCGVMVTEWGVRSDIEATSLQAATANAIHRALAALSDELAAISIESSNEAAKFKQDLIIMVHNTITQTGDHARAYQDATDNSTNMVQTDSRVSQHVADIKQALEQAKLSESERRAATELVNKIAMELQTADASKTVIQALLARLPNVANVVSIAASLVGLIK